MNNGKSRRTRQTTPTALASAALCAAAVCTTAHAAGGVIFIQGMIAAPSFATYGGGALHAGASPETRTSTVDTSGRTTYVSYVAEPNAPPSADVSLTVAGHRSGAAALAVQFTDGNGRTMQPRAGGTYHVGALGGTLSIRAKDGAAASNTQVAVVTNYQ